jgi:hypothetical protein
LYRHNPGGTQGKQHPLGCARGQQVAEVTVEESFGLVQRLISANALLCWGWSFQNCWPCIHYTCLLNLAFKDLLSQLCSSCVIIH